MWKGAGMNEFWAIHEKKGKATRYAIASWFSPVMENVGEQSPEQYAKRIAKLLTDKGRKYRAVKYVQCKSK
jgi:hypothetical protein